MTNGENNQYPEQPCDNFSAESEFLCALKDTNSCYLAVVIACLAMVAGGIAIAAFLNVFIGLAIGILAVLAYMISTKIILERFLGISHKSTSGELAIFKLKARGKRELFIPGRLLWLDVTEIDGDAFNDTNGAGVELLHLPATLKAVGENVFEGCSALKRIYFEGSEAQWNAIEGIYLPEGVELCFHDTSAYTLPKKEKKAKSDVKSDTAPEVKEDEEQ